MNLKETNKALKAAVVAARAAGKLMRDNLRAAKVVNEAKRHDIKLELDVRCQGVIERLLKKALPQAALLGEEGTAGDPEAALRWVVDPIDGTVNFAYGIPHACTSIALQERVDGAKDDEGNDGYRTIVGVVYDPFTDELWTATAGGKARLNGRVVRVSDRTKLSEAIYSVGFSKSSRRLSEMLGGFNYIVHRVRKIRIMGAAALSMAYIASGRMDVYVEKGLRLWDIAAGALLIQCAGGFYYQRSLGKDHFYEMVTGNAALGRKALAMEKRR